MSLTLYPAIDLKDGACVRLRRGEMDEATIYADDPAAQARIFEAAGSPWLHVVDLDGAVAGRSVNTDAVSAILTAIALPVQLGGGIRDMAAIERWLGAGIARIILGSAALKNPILVHQACRSFPDRIVVGIDARAGFVATEGWAETSTMRALDLARRFEDVGVAAIIYTDIARDGMLEGINIEQTMELASVLRTPVIASGGLGSAADLAALRDAARGGLAPAQGSTTGSGCGIEGVIVGRALYDGRISVAEALDILRH